MPGVWSPTSGTLKGSRSLLILFFYSMEGIVQADPLDITKDLADSRLLDLRGNPEAPPPWQALKSNICLLSIKRLLKLHLSF